MCKKKPTPQQSRAVSSRLLSFSFSLLHSFCILHPHFFFNSPLFVSLHFSPLLSLSHSSSHPLCSFEPPFPPLQHSSPCFSQCLRQRLSPTPLDLESSLRRIVSLHPCQHVFLSIQAYNIFFDSTFSTAGRASRDQGRRSPFVHDTLSRCASSARLDFLSVAVRIHAGGAH